MITIWMLASFLTLYRVRISSCTVRGGIFEKKTMGYGTPLFVKYNLGPKSCVKACMMYHGCVAVNYQIEQYSCILLSSLTGKFATRDGYLFSYLDTWTMDDHPCWPNPCKPYNKCITVNTTLCLKYESLTNVAYGKQTWMSTTYSNAFVSSKGVNGIFTGYYEKFATGLQLNPYWFVDFGDVYIIAIIEIYNKADAWISRLRDLDVNAGETQVVSEMVKCGHYVGPDTTADVKVITCPDNTKGRYVMLQIMNQDPQSLLNLAEVQVFARKT